jgi:hypothetical protein
MPYADEEIRKAKQREYARKNYLANKERYKEAAHRNMRLYAIRNAEYVKAIKDNPCTDCGKRFHHKQMHFDHLEDNKRANIADMTRRAYSIETLQAEIDKCELVCESCHGYRTHARLKEGIRYNLPEELSEESE